MAGNITPTAACPHRQAIKPRANLKSFQAERSGTAINGTGKRFLAQHFDDICLRNGIGIGLEASLPQRLHKLLKKTQREAGVSMIISASQRRSGAKALDLAQLQVTLVNLWPVEPFI